MLLCQAPLRGTDDWGSGAFGSSRVDRIHTGEDVVMAVGSLVMAPVSGKITKLGFAYADDPTYRIVDITDSKNNRHRLFYVQPLDTIKVGQHVAEGALVGEVQDVAERYNELTIKGGHLTSKLMKNHVHYEIINGSGEYLDPKEFI